MRGMPLRVSRAADSGHSLALINFSLSFPIQAGQNNKSYLIIPRHQIRCHLNIRLLVIAFLVGTAISINAAEPALGLFDQHADVGAVLHAGITTYDAAAKSYSITGSGENMWSVKDAFQFAWKTLEEICRSRPTSSSRVSGKRRTAKRA